jgi:small subunit ribosomal protein S9
MVKTEIKKSEKTHSRYYEGVGRRKTAIARVRISKGEGSILINGKKPEAYFGITRLVKTVSAPLDAIKIPDKLNISVKVVGGGITAQAEAIRHGFSRALVILNKDFKKKLRNSGYLTRDSRMVERKKYGLKKARKAPQWAKR